jgi:hypothetical protein
MNTRSNTRNKPLKPGHSEEKGEDHETDDSEFSDNSDSESSDQSKYLIVSLLPEDITEQECFGLSKDIKNVFITYDTCSNLTKIHFAYLTFANSKVQKLNFIHLKTGAKIRKKKSQNRLIFSHGYLHESNEKLFHLKSNKNNEIRRILKKNMHIRHRPQKK